MYYNPRPLSKETIRRIWQDIQENRERQLRERFGLDPAKEILIVERGAEYMAYGATYQNRKKLKSAGFWWDDEIKLWRSRRLNHECLKGIPYKVLTVGNQI